MTRFSAIGFAFAFFAIVIPDGPAIARNRDCADGIKYVAQGMSYKRKGKLEDCKREIGRAVEHLERCRREEGTDLEATGYLAWAYAESGRSEDAAQLFQVAIDGLVSRREFKEAALFIDARDAYGLKPSAGGLVAPSSAAGSAMGGGGRVEGELDQVVNALATSIQATLSARDRKRVAVVPFSRLGGGVSELGVFLADKLTNRLFGTTGGFAVVDRFHLDEALAEIRLGYGHLQEPESAKRLGKILGADALVTGTLTQLDRTFDATVRLVDTETSDVLATAEALIPRDATTERLWAATVSSTLGRAAIESTVTPKAADGSAPVPSPAAPACGKPLPAGHFFLEDFSGYATGTVPEGWTESGIAVTMDGAGGRREFTNIEARNNLTIESCKISFPEDFDFAVEFWWDYGNIGFRLGGLVIRFRDIGEGQVGGIRSSVKRGLTNTPHILMIRKRRQLVSVLLDDWEVGTASASTVQLSSARFVITNANLQYPFRKFGIRRIRGRVAED